MCAEKSEVRAPDRGTLVSYTHLDVYKRQAYLRNEKAKAEQKLRSCQNREKILERRMSELNRRERVHRPVSYTHLIIRTTKSSQPFKFSAVNFFMFFIRIHSSMFLSYD